MMKMSILGLSALMLTTSVFSATFRERAVWVGVGQWQMVGGPSGAANMLWESCGDNKGGRSAVDLVGLAAFDGLYKFTTANAVEPGGIRVNPYAPTVGQPTNTNVHDISWLVDNNAEGRFVHTGGQILSEQSYFNTVVQQGVQNDETGFLQDEDKLIRNGKLTLADGTVIFYNSIGIKQNYTTDTCDRLK